MLCSCKENPFNITMPKFASNTAIGRVLLLILIEVEVLGIYLRFFFLNIDLAPFQAPESSHLDIPSLSV
jgi:hypothetical protein